MTHWTVLSSASRSRSIAGSATLSAVKSLAITSTATPIATRPRTVERERGSTAVRASASMTRHYGATSGEDNYRQTTAYRQGTIAGGPTRGAACIGGGGSGG